MSVVSRKIRSRQMSIVLAAVVLRAIIPLGYMPGNLLAGEFMVLCPTGLPAGVSISSTHDHHGHHDHGDGQDAMVDADRACPIGAALKHVALPVETVEAVPFVAFDVPPQAVPSALHPSRTAAPYQPRAPPKAAS